MTEAKSPIFVELGAKASVEIKAEVPSSSVGRLVDAITDIIRPFSERRGLNADKIRLEREEVLFEIACRARARIEVDGKPYHPIPSKFLIPLLEKASLEDPADQTLMDMWGNLLATAATEEVTLLSQYVEILSQISGKQVRILQDMILKGVETTELSADRFHDNFDYLNQTGLPGIIRECADCETTSEVGDNLVAGLDILGVAIDTLQVWNDEDESDEWAWASSVNDIFSDGLFLDFAMLERLGLIRKVEIKGEKIGKFDLYLHYYLVTPIGADLFACCNPSKLRRGSAHSPRISPA